MGKASPPLSLQPELWRLVRHALLAFLFVMTTSIAIYSCYPVLWLCSSIIKLLKSNKPARKVDSYRDISLLDPCAKALHGSANDHFRRGLSDVLLGSQYGFCDGRAASHAVTHVSELSYRLRRAKIKHALFFGDIHKAFSRVPHHLLFSAVHKMLTNKGIQWLIELRHQEYWYIVRRGSSSRAIRVKRGIVEGDKLGPLLFVLFFHEYLVMCEDTTPTEILVFLTPVPGDADKYCNGALPDLCFAGDVTFADDEALVIPFSTLQEVSVRIAHVCALLASFGFTLSLPKCGLLFALAGDGSREVQNSLGKHLDVPGWGKVDIHYDFKHLGTFHSATGSTRSEAVHRLGLAQKAMGSISRKVIRCRYLSTVLRCRLYAALVMPILLYNLVPMPYPEVYMRKFETFHIRNLRYILASPGHISMLEIATLESAHKLTPFPQC